jgi:hypothetical protein
MSTIDELWWDCRCWITLETMLFETLGAAARSAQTPTPARRVLGAWSNRHGWHADLWRQREPVIPHHEFATDDDLSWVDSTRSALDADLAALVDPVLTTMQDHVAEHRSRIDPLLDGSTARILDLVAADLVTEIGELRPLLG